MPVSTPYPVYPNVVKINRDHAHGMAKMSQKRKRLKIRMFTTNVT